MRLTLRRNSSQSLAYSFNFCRSRLSTNVSRMRLNTSSKVSFCSCIFIFICDHNELVFAGDDLDQFGLHILKMSCQHYQQVLVVMATPWTLRNMYWREKPPRSTSIRNHLWKKTEQWKKGTEKEKWRMKDSPIANFPIELLRLLLPFIRFSHPCYRLGVERYFPRGNVGCSSCRSEDKKFLYGITLPFRSIVVESKKVKEENDTFWFRSFQHVGETPVLVMDPSPIERVKPYKSGKRCTKQRMRKSKTRKYVLATDEDSCYTKIKSKYTRPDRHERRRGGNNKARRQRPLMVELDDEKEPEDAVFQWYDYDSGQECYGPWCEDDDMA